MKLEAYALVAAAVLHLAIPVAAKIAPAHALGWLELPTLWTPPSEIDLEAEVESARPLDERAPEPEWRGDPREAPPPGTESQRPPGMAARTGAPLALVPTAPGVTAPGPEGPAPDPNGVLTAPGAGDSEFSMPPGMVGYPGGGGAGLGAYPGGVWSLLGDGPGQRGPAAPTAAPRRGEIPGNIGGRVLDDRLADRDRELGMELPSAGRVQGIVESAARMVSDLPEEFVGAFAVSLGPQGEFQGIQLLSSSGGSSGQWAEVVKIAKGQLGAQKFAMRSAYEKGAIITVSVRAQIRDVSGAKSTFSNFDISSAVAGPVRVVSSSSSVQAIR
ncbi:MAG: hypothetical protein HY908_23835 [Myxococcales bacterium]|nr:hypothetical protein [Myxococcales bacterium]